MPALGLEVDRSVVDALFDAWDPDGSGEIDMKELNKQLRRGGEVKLDKKMALALANEQVRVLHGAARRMIDAAAAREERAQRTYRESTRHLQPEMPALPSELLAWGGSAPPPSVPVRSTFKTLFKQQQLVQKREEERAEAAALESKATKRLANMASIAASKSMRSMPGLAR